MHSLIDVKTDARMQLINITARVAEAVAASGVQEGLCTITVPHTTAGVTINEAADPTVVKDILMELEKIVPAEDGYRHMEGNSAAHIKASMMGSSCQLPVSRGLLVLGTWQGIFFCEFDGPRARTARITLLSG